MTSDIKGEQRSIGGVFSDEFEFQIPPYQRPYLWETEHAGDLMDDLLGFMGETNTPVNSLDPYFLGSIVLIKNNSPESQIVDGQQRLVTLTILLSVFRALVPNEYTDGITKRIYEAEDRVAGLAARFRLHPKAQDLPFSSAISSAKAALPISSRSTLQSFPIAGATLRKTPSTSTTNWRKFRRSGASVWCSLSSSAA